MVDATTTADPLLRPAAYGYVRHDGGDSPAIAVLRQEVSRFCHAAGLQLVGVCCDHPCDGAGLTRPGFAAVLDALARPDAAVLVVPTLRHLSGDVAVRATLLRSVRRSGARLLVIRDDAGGEWQQR